MGAPLDTQKLGSIFQSRPDILDGIQRAADTPARIALFNEIATHIHDHFQENGEPASKRRKVDSSQHGNGPNGAAVEGPDPVDDEILLEIKEISVSVPQRKKLEMCLTQHYLYARAPGTTAPLPGAVFAWKDIEYIFYLPVPEKAQVQHNYVVIPRGACLPAPKTDTPTTPIEPLVFTVPATPPKAGTIGGREASKASSVSDTYKSLFHWAFDTRLKSAGNKVEIVSGNPQRFHSVIRQAQRPNEKAVHVGAYKGSKDGFLFFLENGIMWGFKKPLLFIPLNRIVAISYTNILQITFNIVVEVLIGDGDATEEVEFSMLDQQDYGGIDGYIKANHLQDGSMAEQRKAKLQLAENKKGSKQEGGENGEGAGTADGDAGNGMTELEKAQGDLEQQLQDDEDEDEEDYDPGSEGDSEGSGSSDDDDDDDDDDDEEEEEDEDDVGEGEEAEGENEEEVKEPIPVKEEAKPPPPAPKAAPKAAPKSRASKAAATPASAPAPVPVRQGFAPMNAAPASNGMDLDEEFDVVG